MSGGLEQSSFDTSAYPTVRIALFWNPSGETPRPASQLVEQTSASQAVAVGNPYILNMFDLPGADHIARTYDGRSRGFGIGRVLGYADLDANGRYSDGDKFVSLWSDVALFYAASDLPSWASPTSGSLSAGFYQLLLPQRCDKPIPTPTDSGTCGITLGKSAAPTQTVEPAEPVCAKPTFLGPLDTAQWQTRPLQAVVPQQRLTMGFRKTFPILPLRADTI